jgi:hypothetical protein
MHGRQGERVAALKNAEISANKWQQHIVSSVGSHNAKVADIHADGNIDIAGKNYEGDKRPRIWVNSFSKTPRPAFGPWQPTWSPNSPSTYESRSRGRVLWQGFQIFGVTSAL